MSAAETTEQELAAKAVAPRVTLEQVRLSVVEREFIVRGTLTLCILTLYNGFTVTGESAAASPENFDPEIGQRLAFENAERKVWPLLGFKLKDKLHVTVQSIDRIAMVCHEVNRAYCEALGDHSQRPWADAPVWQRESARKGVCLHLSNPDAGPQASHESWMAEKEATGWKYGPVKDEAKKEHHCMVPFHELPPAQQAKDFIFRAVVHAVKGAL